MALCVKRPTAYIAPLSHLSVTAPIFFRPGISRRRLHIGPPFLYLLHHRFVRGLELIIRGGRRAREAHIEGVILMALHDPCPVPLEPLVVLFREMEKKNVLYLVQVMRVSNFDAAQNYVKPLVLFRGMEKRFLV